MNRDEENDLDGSNKQKMKKNMKKLNGFIK